MSLYLRYMLVEDEAGVADTGLDGRLALRGIGQGIPSQLHAAAGELDRGCLMRVVHGDHHKHDRTSTTGRGARPSAGAAVTAFVRVAAQSTRPGGARPNESDSSTARAVPGGIGGRRGIRSPNAPGTRR
ncbi:hypothetical protein GCM10009579_31000 [Streptomyces javensis]|uniref:Uncharacterized protein n=1 Tax=Streptomyces javensis TaxID=114698 RepID=A0ABP4HJI8_9ACTN